MLRYLINLFWNNRSKITPKEHESFSFEIVEQMFTHLSGNELIICKLVSKKWNKIIENSSRCQNKITFFINKSNVKKLDQNTFISPKNVTIYGPSRLEEKICKFIEGSSLNYLCIKNATFPTISSFMQFLNFCSSSVTELRLKDVKIMKADESTLKVDFKNLNKLTIKNCSDSITLDLFESCHELLTKLCVHYKNLLFDAQAPRGVHNIVAALNKANRLEDLSLAMNYVTFHLFIRGSEFYQFKLKSFELHDFRNYPLISHEIENLDNFLIKQTSIERLVLNGSSCYTFHALTTPLRMKNLKHLKVEYYPQIVDEVIANSFDGTFDCLNESIETLSFIHYCHRWVNKLTSEEIKTFLKSVPNLKELGMALIDEDLAEFISENLPKLRKVTAIQYVNLEYVQQVLPTVELYELEHSFVLETIEKNIYYFHFHPFDYLLVMCIIFIKYFPAVLMLFIFTFLTHHVRLLG